MSSVVARLSHCWGQSTHSQPAVLLQVVVAMCPWHTFIISCTSTYLLQSEPAKDVLVKTTQPTFSVMPVFHVRNMVNTSVREGFASKAGSTSQVLWGADAPHSYIPSLTQAQGSECYVCDSLPPCSWSKAKEYWDKNHPFAEFSCKIFYYIPS